jgi:DNA-binding NtrC family response regulator
MPHCCHLGDADVDLISVLIVDDEVLMREVLVRWLRAAGYGATEAPDATTALDLLAGGEFDVVLVDIEMPGRDGLWLVHRLRERFPTVAIVLATASDTVPPAVSMQEGVVEYLLKPFELERVVAAVKRAVDWRRTVPATPSAADGNTKTVAEWLSTGSGLRRSVDGGTE